MVKENDEIGSEKGQVSIFVIIGILIIVIMMLVVFFIGNNDLKRSDPTFDPVISFVERCVDETSLESVFHVAERGGYFISPDGSLYAKYPYYYDEGKINILSLEEIEENMNEYVEQSLFFCTKNFVDFPDFEVNQGEVIVKSNIEEEVVTFKIDFPLSISKGGFSVSLSDFTSEVPSRLFTLHEISSKIMEDHNLYPNQICHTCLLDYAEEYDLFVDLVDKDSDKVIFTVRDEESFINDERLKFKFVNRYEII